MVDRTGQRIGNYQLIRLLGRGGFADVYLGEHVYLKTQAAVKILSNQLKVENVEIFTREAQTVATLKHPHILRVLDFGFDGPTCFLTMEYAPFGTLRDRHPRGSLVPVASVIAYVKQVAAALHYAHTQAKIIHRDVKPENMLINDEQAILLGDFGIAAMVHNTVSLENLDRSGTPYYMAPEQIQRKPRPASDQYALAIVVYEWLCGQRPFDGDNFISICMQHLTNPLPSLRARNPRISRDVEQVVSTALAKDPQQRFSTIQAFATALEQASQTANATISPVPGATKLVGRPTRQLAETGTRPALLADIQAFSPGSEQGISDGEQGRVDRGKHGDDDQREGISLQSKSLREEKAQNEPEVVTLTPLPKTPVLPHRPAFSWRRGVLLLLIALILGGGAFYYALSLLNSTSAKNPTVAHISGTLTPVVHTATSISSTATSRPRAATPTSQRSPTPGIPAGWHQVLNDPLTLSHHDTFWESDPTCLFTQLYYEATSTGSNYCSHGDSTSNSFGDLVYSIDLSIHQGREGGLIFRNVKNNYYYFSITTEGNYLLALHTSADGGDDTPIAQGSSAAIRQGRDQWNTLKVVAQGSSFKLYINQRFIAIAHDATRDRGVIGVAVNGPGPQSVFGDVRFRNAGVWIP